MTLQQALKLYPDTMLFHESGVVGLASPLRKYSAEHFGYVTALSLCSVCNIVWAVMAKEYYSLVNPGNVNPW